MSRRILVAALAAAVLMSCQQAGESGREEETSSALRDTTRPPTTDDQLGYSWDGIQERVKGACVTPAAVITTPYNVATLTMDQVLTTDQAASVLGYSAEGKAKFGLLGVEAKAKFARSLAANKFSISNYFGYDLLTRQDSIDLRVDPTWLVSTEDPDWYLKCGDQYLQEKTFGGQLFVLYRIDFATESDKQEFSASMGASWNAGAKTISGEVSKVSTRFTKRASIHLEALQIGGDATKLASVVGGSATDTGGGRVVLDCTMENLAPCGTFMQNAANYAATGFADSVRQQPQFRTETFRDWDGLRVVTHPSRSVPAPLFQARLQLLSLLDSQLAFSERVAALQSGKFWVPAGIAQQLGTYAARVGTNLIVLNSRTRVCWDDITDPSSTAQVDACAAAVGMPSLTADGYTDDLNLDLLEIAANIEYQVAQPVCKSGAYWCTYDGRQVTSIQWLNTVAEGGTAGNIAAAIGPRPILGLRVWKTQRLPSASRICYQLHVRGSWRAEACDGAVSGETSGFNAIVNPQGDQVRIRLEGAPGVSICYRAFTGGSWLPPVCDWTVAGLPGANMAGLQVYTVR